MYRLELRRVERSIKRRCRMGMLDGREIFLFGVSDNSRQIIQMLREYHIEPKNVIDNDTSKQNSYCSRLKVISLDSIDNPAGSEKIYIIYSSFWREMILQLKQIGVGKDNIWKLAPKPKTLLGQFASAVRGNQYRRAFKRKYGDIPVFLCPYTGTGDIYLIGTFWDEYVKRNHIPDYVFLVMSDACRKVANLFDIKNIELVKNEKYAAALIHYYLYDPAGGKIKILNDCWPQIHANQTEWFRGYKGLYFTQLFRRFLFNLPDDVKPKHPQYRDEGRRVDGLFEEWGLEKGRTVVLSPYSNTLSDLPMEFWEDLALELGGMGYCVVTNCGGKTEPAVRGTKGIFFPLDLAPQFVEAAGAFVGVRSGLCDVVSGASAKKAVLYDAGNRFYMGSAFAYFSLKDMELCDDALELEFHHDRIEDAKREILRYFA